MRNARRPLLISRLILVTTLMLCLAASRADASNELTTIVLHAVDATTAACTDDGGLDCQQVLPVIDVTGMQSPGIFVYLRNYELISGLQCAFEWSPDWVLLYTLWTCQSNQVNGTTPTASGTHDGTIATAFDAIAGGPLATIGQLFFSSAATGCLTIIDSDYPFGTHVVDPATEVTWIQEGNRGRICVGMDGWNSCEPEFRPVESASWGQIRRQFRHQPSPSH